MQIKLRASNDMMPPPRPTKRAQRANEVLGIMFRWLRDVGYMSAVPLVKLRRSLSGNLQAVRDDQLQRRVLTERQWQAIDRAVDSLSASTDPKYARRHMIAVWLHDTGARVHELAKASRLDISRVANGGRELMMWHIIGKGGHPRNAYLTTRMIQAYKSYRLARGLTVNELSPFEATIPGESKFLLVPDREYRIESLARLNSDLHFAAEQRLSVRAAFQEIKELAETAAKSLSNPADRMRVRALSPHWYRHRFGFDLIQALPPSQVAQLLGHQSLDTTLNYSQSEEVDLGFVALDALARRDRGYSRGGDALRVALLT